MALVNHWSLHDFTLLVVGCKQRQVVFQHSVEVFRAGGQGKVLVPWSSRVDGRHVGTAETPHVHIKSISQSFSPCSRRIAGSYTQYEAAISLWMRPFVIVLLALRLLSSVTGSPEVISRKQGSNASRRRESPLPPASQSHPRAGGDPTRAIAANHLCRLPHKVIPAQAGIQCEDPTTRGTS